MDSSRFEFKELGGFNFIDEGNDKKGVILLLHGLFGTASNFESVIEEFRNEYRVLLPELPIFSMPLRKVSLVGLVEFLNSFVRYMKINSFHLVGNSLGGHLALLYVLQRMDIVKSLTLTGSSGLYESAFGNTVPQRNNRAYIENKIKLTFYDPAVATPEMIDEVFGIVNNRLLAIRIVKMAKSAIRNNLEEEISRIKVPTLLVWGNQDTITPPFVGEKFNTLLPDSQLVFLDKCGHAPMLELPDAFNNAFGTFISQFS